MKAEGRIFYIVGAEENGKAGYWSKDENCWFADFLRATRFSSRDQAGQYVRSMLSAWELPHVSVVSVQIETSETVRIRTAEKERG